MLLDPDSREQKLKEDLENSRREIDFLNSVIVDMQRKCDELRMQLEISKATLLGQNVVGDSPQYLLLDSTKNSSSIHSKNPVSS